MTATEPASPSRCPQCGYSLDGIAASICPECGIDTDLLRDSLFRDHVESMVNTSVCYGIAGGIWLVIALMFGMTANSAFAFGIVFPIPASHLLVSHVLYRRRFRLLSGVQCAKHTSILSKLSLAFSLLALAFVMTALA